jgi:hypothetical protein
MGGTKNFSKSSHHDRRAYRRDLESTCEEDFRTDGAVQDAVLSTSTMITLVVEDILVHQ